LKQRILFLFIAILSGLLVQLLPVANAEGKKSEETLTTLVTAEVLKSKIAEVEAATNLEEQAKNSLVELYRRALTNLEKLSSYQASAATFAQTRKTEPADTQKLLKALKEKEKSSPEKTLTIPVKTSLLELEQQTQKEKADLAAVEAKLSDLNARLDNQANRPSAARERLIAAKRQQETAIAGLNAAVPEGELAALTKARSWAGKTQAVELSAEIKMLDQELLSYQTRVQLLEAKKGMAEHNVGLVEARVRLLEGLLSKRRLAEAEQAKKEADAVKEEFKEKHPLIRKLAEQNAVLGEELTIRAIDLERISALDEKARKNAKRVGDDLSTIRKKLDVAGLSQALGRVLMQQRRTLPQLTVIQRETRQREQLIADSGLRQIQYGEERRRLRNIGTYVSGLMQDLPQDAAGVLHPQIWELAAKRRELLDKASATEAAYLRILGELDLAQRQLIDVVETYDEFLGKRLLWIRSTEPVNAAVFKGLPGEFARLLSFSSWFEASSHLLLQLGTNLLGPALILVLLALIFMRVRLLKAVVATGEKVGRIRTDRFTYSLQALGLTALASAPLPLLFMTIGWQLSLAPEADVFSKAIAAGLIRFAHGYLILLFFTDVCISGGIAVKHLRWPVDAAAKLHRELKLLMVLYLPLVFIAIHSINSDKAGVGSGLVMLCLLTVVVVITSFIFRSFAPRDGVLADFLKKHPDSLLSRLRSVWLGFFLVGAIAIAGLVLTGYLFTSAELTRDVINTIYLVFSLVLLHGLVVRWLLLVRRRLAYQAAVERREAARVAREAVKEAEEGAHVGDDEGLEIEEPEVDLAALDEDSRNLLNTAIFFAGVIGLWLIWSGVLPAFGILDDISLWSHVALVDGVEAIVPVTLADLALAFIIGVITVKAANGLPAFLEFILLQRTSITAGGRYTATTLLRYAIVGIGVVFFFTLLGGSWSKIQWLVAALSVGIGFGLQEIVANFISGLIILFERPIRVGDTVTVGDTSGVVTRINIRATTIVNWDRQELLVPNKEFITTKLLNWSLSDPIIRVRVPVGIAYGSDVTKAMILMKEAAEEHDNVLEDPSASVAFVSFGDNALQLVLRVFLPSMDDRIRTITELHAAINRKFNEAGIVIAFPQRDIHLDTSEPLRISIEDTRQGDPVAQ
jgi:potassium efflux system protein